MAICCCCGCNKPEEPEEDYEVYVVEDGDEMQNFGVRHTLELLRRMMNQSGRPIVDQPPPSYAEFDKYPLATEEEEVENKSPRVSNAAQPRHTAVSNWASHEPVQPVLGASGLSVASRQSAWIEPFPKPPGEPPPVPSNWFLTRLASMRRSLAARFAPSTQPVPSPPTQSTPDPPGDTVQPIRIHPTTPIRAQSVDVSQPVQACFNLPPIPAYSRSRYPASHQVPSSAPNEASNPPWLVHKAPVSLTAQSSIQTENAEEHVITVLSFGQNRQFSRSTNNLTEIDEDLPETTTARRYSL